MKSQGNEIICFCLVYSKTRFSIISAKIESCNNQKKVVKGFLIEVKVKVEVFVADTNVLFLLS